MEVIVNGVLNNSGAFKGKYKPDKSFPLDNGVTAHVYIKTDDWMEQDVKEVASFFEKLYPNHPNLFANDFAYYINRKFPK